MCGWDSPVAPGGIGSGLVKPEGLLPLGVRARVFEPLRPPGSHGAERPRWILPNRFPASQLQPDFQFHLVLVCPASGTKRKG